MKKLLPTMPPRQVEHEITHLSRLSTQDARMAWKGLTGQLPGKGMKGDFLARALAHVFQEQMFGTLSEGLSLRLSAIARDTNKSRSTPAEKRTLPERRRILPGCRLVREWQGDLHEVTVVAEGFCWRGRIFTSLSTIAREITGTSWNGWTFFGVNRERRKAPALGEKINA